MLRLRMMTTTMTMTTTTTMPMTTTTTTTTMTTVRVQMRQVPSAMMQVLGASRAPDGQIVLQQIQRLQTTLTYQHVATLPPPPPQPQPPLKVLQATQSP